MTPPNDPDCIFCKIVRREVPASVVDEDEVSMAFLDLRPINPGHALVIPKQHASDLASLPPDVGGRVFAMAIAVAAGLKRCGLRCDGINLHLADGEVAGQEILHVHVHVIPRFEGDGFGLRVGPDYGKIAGRSELDSVAARIRSAMAGSSTS